MARRSQAKRTAVPGPRGRLDFSAAAGQQQDRSSSSSASASSEQIDQRSGTPDAGDLAVRSVVYTVQYTVLYSYILKDVQFIVRSALR